MVNRAFARGERRMEHGTSPEFNCGELWPVLCIARRTTEFSLRGSSGRSCGEALLDDLMYGGIAPEDPIRQPPPDLIVRKSSDRFATDHPC